MEVTPDDVIIRYFQEQTELSNAQRSLFTLAVFLKPALASLHITAGGRYRLDSSLLKTLLNSASPIELANLWSNIGKCFDPEDFLPIFEEAMSSSNDIRTLHFLGGALNDYLRVHPGTVPVPMDFVDRLLASGDREARVVGLKLALRVEDSPAWCLRHIITAMKAATEYEREGGTLSLDKWIGAGQLRHADANMLAEARLLLEQLLRQEPSGLHRKLAQNLLETITIEARERSAEDGPPC